MSWRAGPFRSTLIPARGVAALAHLEAFLPECAALVRAARPTGEVDSVAGWGFKKTSTYARRLAAARGWPYLALEDGFLRSVGLGEAGAPPMSLVVDDLGIYYDGHAPSRLETLLEDPEPPDPAMISRARSLIDQITHGGISKTNATPRLPGDALPSTRRRRVLVVDQTEGDASIVGALADADVFLRMLEAARRDEANAEIIVRRHPAVSAGLKRGCLPDEALDGVTVLDQAGQIADVLARVDAVYTVSSLTGFEALVRGLPVRCFGLPFYAGWGLTNDEFSCRRRTYRHTVESLAAATYLLYPRYVDPLTGEPSTAETIVERLLAFRARSDLHAGYTAALGFAPWKHGAARTLLYSSRGETRFFSSARSAIAAAEAHEGRVVFWAGRETPALNRALANSPSPVLRMEDGFIRSRGLGSDFHPAASIVLDDLGIYYDATRPSRLETLLETTNFDAALLERAARLRARLTAAGVSKYNLRRPDRIALEWPANRPRLLVVGQVEDDKSIETGCESVRTNLGLLHAVRNAHPGAFLIYKPHPDVEAKNRSGVVPEEALAAIADAVAGDMDIGACLTAADGVATMTSLAGFEALLRGKPVYTFGKPFYAGWGLTIDALNCPRRHRSLNIDQLVAGALIAYPTYVDPASGLPCEVEDLVAVLEATKGDPSRTGHRRSRYWRAVAESLRRRSPRRY